MSYGLAYTPYNTNLFMRRRYFIVSIVSTFQARVIADGGTFEAPSCMVSQLTALNNIA